MARGGVFLEAPVWGGEGGGAGYSVLTQTVAGFSSQAIMARGGELGIVF